MQSLPRPVWLGEHHPGLFPQLSHLGGQDLPTPTVADPHTPKVIKPCTEDYKGSKTLKNLIMRFLQEHHLVYDYGDGEGLFSACHDKARFSMTVPLHPKDPAQSSVCGLLDPTNGGG